MYNPLVAEKKNRLVNTLLALLGFCAFTQMTIISDVVLYSIIIVCVGCSVCFYFSIRPKIKKSLILFLIFYLSCFFIGLVSYPFSEILEGGKFDYTELNFTGRLVNLILMASVIIFIDTYHRYNNSPAIQYLFIFRWYHIGITVLLVMGVWQLLSFYIVPIDFPFETRAHLHSTYGEEYSFSKRITSIAAEPSYFVVFAIDFIALTLLFKEGIKKIIYLLLGFLMIIFSLAPSGYLVLIASLAAAWILTYLKNINLKFNIKAVFLISLSLLACIVFLVVNGEVAQYVYNRVFEDTSNKGGRFFMVFMPYTWAADSNVFSFLFGHGIKSYSIIGTYYSLPSGGPVHATSNSIYTDVFWESGVLGLLLLALFFIYLVVRLFNSNLKKYYLFIAFYALFDLFFSGVFRADFASLRFFLMLYLIYIITNIPEFQKAPR